ncbi:sigma factor [Tateyamaria pelophila]|uniref:sigma factor n=1 Tax=Tateyamaria pelophila TaxID=328415 RepID=UPI001CBDAAAB|nr:sigma factor [Tateyamaria pelophila]
MPPKLSAADVVTLIDEANRAARRLHRKLHLPPADLEDLSQDLLLDLICRLPGFDARRGSIGAFANIVLRNQSSRIAMQIQRERRAQDGWMFSLDAPMAGSREPLKNLLLEEDALASWYGQRPFGIDMHHDRLATNCVLARLRDDERQLCRALSQFTASDLVAGSVFKRSSLYRRIAALRPVLTAYGLGPCWDDFGTP